MNFKVSENLWNVNTRMNVMESHNTSVVDVFFGLLGITLVCFAIGCTEEQPKLIKGVLVEIDNDKYKDNLLVVRNLKRNPEKHPIRDQIRGLKAYEQL